MSQQLFSRLPKISLSIFLFIALFSIVHYIKPSIFYLQSGGFRQFGIGYKHKTVIPIWVFAIILSILSYLVISYWILFLK